MMPLTGKAGKERVYIYSFIAVSQNILRHQAAGDQELPEQEVMFFYLMAM